MGGQKKLYYSIKINFKKEKCVVLSSDWSSGVSPSAIDCFLYAKMFPFLSVLLSEYFVMSAKMKLEYKTITNHLLLYYKIYGALLTSIKHSSC